MFKTNIIANKCLWLKILPHLTLPFTEKNRKHMHRAHSVLFRETFSVSEQKGKYCFWPKNVFLFDGNVFHKKQASNSLIVEENFDRNFEQLKVLVTYKSASVTSCINKPTAE